MGGWGEDTLKVQRNKGKYYDNILHSMLKYEHCNQEDNTKNVFKVLIEKIYVSTWNSLSSQNIVLKVK